MNDIAVRVENLSKLYRIGQFGGYKTIRETLMNVAYAPFRHIRSITHQPSAISHELSANSIWALKDVSFEIKRGEAVGIIGKNGSGKTTILKILSRITAPTEGSVEIHGRVGSLLEVGTGFHPELTGRENIYLNGAVIGMKKAEVERKFDEIVAFSEIEKFLDTPVKRFSSGMYVRLAFAVAAHLEPEILIVDEVLAVGDAPFQKKCLGKMGDVTKEGRTVVFVSHNMASITRLCPRAILLDQGEILRDGPSYQVVSGYLDSGLGTMAAREWLDLSKAPGNDVVRLCAVRVRNEAGNVTDSVDIRESVKIEIEYYNFANERFPYANIQLFNEDGICLFASGDFNNMSWRHTPRKFTGKVISTCTIPGNFLSEGRMSILVGLTTHNPNQVYVIERDAVSFVMVDHSQGDGVRGEYTGHFPGVVRPLLRWHIDCDSRNEQGTENKFGG
jgi:lipopolysaccharide transport system ATP-binding protein